MYTTTKPTQGVYLFAICSLSLLEDILCLRFLCRHSITHVMLSRRPWLVVSYRNMCIARIPLGSPRHVSTRHDTFDVSSPCILAVSSLSNSTARHARLDSLDTSNVSYRVETWRDEPSGIWAYILIHSKKNHTWAPTSSPTGMTQPLPFLFPSLPLLNLSLLTGVRKYHPMENFGIKDACRWAL